MTEEGEFVPTKGHRPPADVRIAEQTKARAEMKPKAQTTLEPVNAILVETKRQMQNGNGGVPLQALVRVR